METITLKQALDWLDSGAPFSMAFVTANKRTKIGGEWIVIEKAWKGFELTGERKEGAIKSQPRTQIVRNPNHLENSTRNIRLPNGETRKVHIRLIRRLNGKIII